jgi:hypothetical protein
VGSVVSWLDVDTCPDCCSASCVSCTICSTGVVPGAEATVSEVVVCVALSSAMTKAKENKIHKAKKISNLFILPLFIL